MPGHLSGVDAIGPAFERAKRQLFMPFRFWHWSRLAIVVMSTGELTGGGGGGWSGLGGIPTSPSGSGGKHFLGYALQSDLPDVNWVSYLPLIAVGAFILLLLVLAFIYVASVFRFILFDSVLYDRCELSVGWRRWQQQGISYFFWVIGFGLSGLAVMTILIGGPVYIAWLTGIFNEPDHHIALLIIGGFLLLCVFLGLILVSAIVSLFTRDFVVPVMALENVGVLNGWRRVLPMLGVEKGAFTIYVLMKIGLAMGSAMIFGMINFLVLLLLLIPLGIIAVVVVLVGGAIGLTWNTLTLCAAVLVGGIIVMLLIFVMSFISTPAMVFFQAYTMHFFGSRYPHLGDQLALTSPPPKPVPIIPNSAAPVPAM